MSTEYFGLFLSIVIFIQRIHPIESGDWKSLPLNADTMENKSKSVAYESHFVVIFGQGTSNGWNWKIIFLAKSLFRSLPLLSSFLLRARVRFYVLLFNELIFCFCAFSKSLLVMALWMWYVCARLHAHIPQNWLTVWAAGWIDTVIELRLRNDKVFMAT